MAKSLDAAEQDELLRRAGGGDKASEARLLVTASADYDRVEMLLRRELHRVPTEVEMARKLEWTVERTRYLGQIVTEARRRHDEELLAYIDPETLVIEGDVEAEIDPN